MVILSVSEAIRVGMVLEISTSFCLVYDHFEHLWVLLRGLLDELLEQIRWLRLLSYRSLPLAPRGGHSHGEGGDLSIQRLTHVTPFNLGGFFLFVSKFRVELLWGDRETCFVLLFHF